MDIDYNLIIKAILKVIITQVLIINNAILQINVLEDCAVFNSPSIIYHNVMIQITFHFCSKIMVIIILALIIRLCITICYNIHNIINIIVQTLQD